MLKKVSAWGEILKIAVNAGSSSKEMAAFYRALSVNVLRREGWFDYMATPHTIEDLADHFGYVDMEYLKKYLKVFTEDGLLVKENGSYRTNGVVNEYPVVPPGVFSSSIVQITSDGAACIPMRLKGTYGTFSDNMNTFNWDDTLSLKMYERLRRAAFKFSGALKRQGSFIDIGCGSGVGTASMWGYYYKRGVFKSGTPMKMYALENDPNLLRIAEEEFPNYASKLNGIDMEVVDSLKEYHPTFIQGSADDLPYEDEFFDMVYCSQVIHWCDAEKATKEMVRVLKPGGLLFGTEAFAPFLDKYLNMFITLNEGAYGVVEKEDFLRWAREAGATQAESVTPAGVYRIVK